MVERIFKLPDGYGSKNMKSIVVVNDGIVHVEQGDVVVIDLDEVNAFCCPNCGGLLGIDLVCQGCNVDWDDAISIEIFIEKLKE
jgi:hypothetical protein